ncbi:hypothetical protein MPTK1_4g21800 [Marchantia polymorpha subsp. ruderalis]|uniref:Pherophorin domain-containing protein n=2 Tax=Marchantia polymorpha TaxID=3197 RepID=A0AAF6BCE8_MARPO|nr:hypothetical protein MARPO_0090s0042 [Marchantia polymorpha]BBN09682.1 hypothetical protein Mp_4g21800 [Marchantia polymorpha subsp. ruderalis]|eukprot:PTQ33305.1 hypothetical protein MARPO_0090s0042 [Marchantia polymorpha]
MSVSGRITNYALALSLVSAVCAAASSSSHPSSSFTVTLETPPHPNLLLSPLSSLYSPTACSPLIYLSSVLQPQTPPSLALTCASSMSLLSCTVTSSQTRSVCLPTRYGPY